MNTRIILITSLLLTSGILNASPVSRGFIREVGEYLVDTEGSTITIADEGTGTWSLGVDWRSSDEGITHTKRITRSSVSHKAMIAEGWFVFIESPNRIWVYDGRDNGMLLTLSGIDQTTAAWDGAVMAGCPQKVWEDLPRDVREYWKNLVDKRTKMENGQRRQKRSNKLGSSNRSSDPRSLLPEAF